MEKTRFETAHAWMETKTSGARIDCYYGLTDMTNNHGHLVLSGAVIIYHRINSGALENLSGAFIIPWKVEYNNS